MTRETLGQLTALAESDAALMAELRAASSKDDVVRIARERGIVIDASDITEVSELVDTEVDDAALDSISGAGHPKYGTFTDYTC